MGDRWSLGVLVGLPLAALAALACLLAACFLFYLWRSTGDYSDRGLFAGGFFGAVVALVATVIFTGWSMWPWVGEYHRWHTTSGTVTAISSRLIGSDTKGGGTTQRFVVTLAGVGQRSCDDTRCAEVKAGDRLTLSCKRAWQYAGTPGYDCNYIEDHR